jgi:hypothetical protein
MDQSLTTILKIYRLVVQEQYSLEDASREISKMNDIEYSELLSSCTKTLNISRDTFGHFLESENTFNFKNFLIRRFPDEHRKIISFFNSFELTSDIPILDLTKLTKISSRTEPPSFNRNGMMSSLKENLQDWIARNDIPQDLKDELKGWVVKIESHS